MRTNSILGFVVDVVSLGANLQRPDTVLLRRIADASSISAVTRVINFVLGDPAKDSRGANYVDFGDTLYVFEFTAYNSNHIFSARYVAVYTNEDNLKYHNSYILIDFSPVDMGGAIHE